LHHIRSVVRHPLGRASWQGRQMLHQHKMP
jgi:hypothetical protein